MNQDSSTDSPTFKIFFNKKRQWIDIYLWDVHPNTFANWKAGRWGYFIAKWENPKLGIFGEIHLVKSRVREDVVVHELFHALTEWMWANRISMQSSNEERLVSFLDKLVGDFYREYRKIK